MTEREYKVLVARDRAGIYALAGDDWTVLENSIKEFQRLDTDDDLSFGDIGRVSTDGPGYVALCYK